ncbi:MAG TPA: DUF4280 domain-containing protein [Allosphingosinicella sp.]|jgi:hypothetical protein
MANLLSEGAILSCSFGSATMPMIVPPEVPILATSLPTATIMSFVPEENIPSFGMCSSPSNPAVIAATAEAHGVPTPAPCVPMTTTPWAPGAPRVRTGGVSVLCSGSVCLCNWAGEVSIGSPGQMRVTVQG